MALHDIYLLSELSNFAVAPPIVDTLSDPTGLPAVLSQSELAYVNGSPILRLGPPIKAILDPVLMLIGTAVAALCWGVWRHKRKKREAVLDAAWREVLADPHYLERRQLEERRLETKDRHREAQ